MARAAAPPAGLADSGAVGQAVHQVVAVVRRGTAPAARASARHRLVAARIAQAGGTAIRADHVGAPLTAGTADLGGAAVAAMGTGCANATTTPRRGIADVRAGRLGAVRAIGRAVSRRWARSADVSGGHALARASASRRVADEGARSGRIVRPVAGRVAGLRRASVALMVVRLAGLALAFAARNAGAVGQDLPMATGVARLPP